MFVGNKLPPPPDLDPLSENLLSCGQIAKILPAPTGRRASPSTVWRWCRHGRDGVRLPHVRVGRMVLSSREAVKWFITASTQARLDRDDDYDTEDESQSDAELEAELRAEGL